MTNQREAKSRNTVKIFRFLTQNQISQKIKICILSVGTKLPKFGQNPRNIE
jgi:hypothetical protein